MINSINEIWAQLLIAAVSFLLFVASSYAILFEKEAKKAICWTALIWLVPVLGAILYFLYKLRDTLPPVTYPGKKLATPETLMTQQRQPILSLVNGRVVVHVAEKDSSLSPKSIHDILATEEISKTAEVKETVSPAPSL